MPDLNNTDKKDVTNDVTPTLSTSGHNINPNIDDNAAEANAAEAAAEAKAAEAKAAEAKAAEAKAAEAKAAEAKTAAADKDDAAAEADKDAADKTEAGDNPLLGGKRSRRRRGGKKGGKKGGKSRRGGTAWTDLVKRVFNQNKHKSGYKFKNALMDAKKIYNGAVVEPSGVGPRVAKRVATRVAKTVGKFADKAIGRKTRRH